MSKKRSKGNFQKRKYKEAMIFQHNKKIVWELNFIKYGEYTCEECGKSPLYRNKSGESKMRDDLLTVDHIIERKNGGKDTVENLRTTCAQCNNFRSNPPRSIADVCNYVLLEPEHKCG